MGGEQSTAVRTVTVEVSGMHCASCGLLVDDCLEDVEGVRSSTTDIRSGRCVAVVDEDVTDEQVLAAVAEAGYAGTVLGSGPG
ncbi:MAG TPA: cation transporter [Pengzhenrongella sp.]